MSEDAKPEAQLPDTLVWLWDAPLFIDEQQIGRFYDAIARPETKLGKTTLTISAQQAQRINAKLGLSAGVTIGELGQLLTKFVKPEFKASGEGTFDSNSQSSESKSIELHEISTPERQLVQLTLHYLLQHEDRLFLVDNPATEDWRLPDTIQQVPRALAFLDLPGHDEAHYLDVPDTKIIPTAAEFENGKIVQLFKKLKAKDGNAAPDYPERAPNPNDLRTLRRHYWQWFDDNFSATQAMVVVEEAASENGRIRWIDYRVPVTRDGDTLHLHVCPAGKYDTGVFAYNFIKRGFKHGLRLVGTLKSEPDMNVIAIYEK
jgi:hypothetical protein